MSSDEAEMPLIKFTGETFTPLLSGALFWPAENTLLVADLHLEKMSSFAMHGQLLPPYDTGATLALLQKDIKASGANRVICLGDSFHRDEGPRSLGEQNRQQLNNMIAEVEWLWLSGNHDPSPHHLGGTCVNDIDFGNLFLCHEPDKKTHGQIAGHLHPSARIRINGRTTQRPCFVHDERLLIVPAYGVSTGTLNILSHPFEGLFDRN
ncbi:MAG: ligase-associated DNA damage response endonuclease PdeM [Devosiaceae bacterium]|nr:ligase-associated DNA damage response endonuclease PdeM [Devosiaceae bacterium]